ncbi:hypothetical protein P7K49_014908 [Saguinus oedipus]|uniref:Uncharacterized protein n=1 Tax=Saguinus oedipus TaxID=9490 RepID=A0ABQ9V7Q7_SAGOE|nr:hypothetical protein P7K49_014908 [Saguinus oedipus]
MTSDACGGFRPPQRRGSGGDFRRSRKCRKHPVWVAVASLWRQPVSCASWGQYWGPRPRDSRAVRDPRWLRGGWHGGCDRVLSRLPRREVGTLPGCWGVVGDVMRVGSECRGSRVVQQGSGPRRAGGGAGRAVVRKGSGCRRSRAQEFVAVPEGPGCRRDPGPGRYSRGRSLGGVGALEGPERHWRGPGQKGSAPGSNRPMGFGLGTPGKCVSREARLQGSTSPGKHFGGLSERRMACLLAKEWGWPASRMVSAG